MGVGREGGSRIHSTVQTLTGSEGGGAVLSSLRWPHKLKAILDVHQCKAHAHAHLTEVVGGGHLQGGVALAVSQALQIDPGAQ